MEEKLAERLESTVVRLEAISGVSPEGDGDAAALDPSIVAFDEQILGSLIPGANFAGGEERQCSGGGGLEGDRGERWCDGGGSKEEVEREISLSH